MTNASDNFFGGGQALNWGPTSDTRWLNRPRGGRVVGEPRQEQQTDINTRQPLWWDAERTRPMMQLVIPVCCDGSGYAAQQGWHTDERVDASDNGHRNWYIKGKDLTEALGNAIKTNGVPGVRMGDEVYGVWTGMRPGKTAGTTARTWWATHIVGAPPAQQQFFGNEQQPQAPQQAAAPAGFAPSPQGPSGLHTQAHGFAPAPPQQPAPAAQGNAYGFGHQPPASPGGQAFAAAQQPAQPQPWAAAPAGAAPNPGPPPQFGAPPAQQQAAPPAPVAQWGQATPGQEQWAQQQAPAGPPPTPPVDNPWGAVAPAQNPYGG
jgi:hypothetical protein